MNGENPLSDSPGLQPAGSPHAGEGLDPAAAKELAAATHDAAQATERLNTAVAKTNRLYRDSPAVKAANQAAEAARKLAREQERAGKGKPAGVSRSTIGRTNADLEAAFAAPLSRPKPPAANLRDNPALDAVFGVHPHAPPPLPPTRAPLPDRPDPIKERAEKIQRDTGRTPDGRPVNALIPAPPLFPGRPAHTLLPPPPPVPAVVAPELAGRPTFRESMDLAGNRAASYGNRGLGYARVAAAGYESIAEANRTPFMDDVSRRRQAAEGLPFGEVIGMIGRAIEDMKAGGGNNQKGQEEIMVARQAAVIRSARATMLSTRIPEEDREQGIRAEAEKRAELMRQYIRPDPLLGRNRVPQIDNMGWRGTGMPDRSTVAGRDEYNLRRALLPPKDRLDAAEREVSVRKAALREIEDRDDTYKQNIAAAEKRAAAAKQVQAEAADDPTRLRMASKYAEERSFITDLTERRSGIADQREQAKKAFAEAEFERNTQLRAMGQVRLGDLERREDVARGQAERLGMMGFDGRIQTMLAKRTLDQVGIENAPGELIQQAAAGFPDTVRTEAQRGGQQFVSEFKQFGREEFRDELPDIRKQVDDKLKQMRQDEANAVAESLDRIVEAIVEGNRERAKMFEEKVKAAIEKLDADSRLKSLK